MAATKHLSLPLGPASIFGSVLELPLPVGVVSVEPLEDPRAGGLRGVGGAWSHKKGKGRLSVGYLPSNDGS